MSTPVYMIFMNGADKSWLIIREEAWDRLQGAPFDPILRQDIEAHFHPDDWNEFTETLEDLTLMQKDVVPYLPPICIGGETGEFFDVTSLSKFLTRHDLVVVGEFTHYS